MSDSQNVDFYLKNNMIKKLKRCQECGWKECHVNIIKCYITHFFVIRVLNLYPKVFTKWEGPSLSSGLKNNIQMYFYLLKEYAKNNYLHDRKSPKRRYCQSLQKTA